MIRYVLPSLFAALLWWLSTGVVLYAVNRPQQDHAKVLAAATALLAAGCGGIFLSSTSISLAGVYGGFLSALAIWAWHEVTFLFGIITGPNTSPSVQRPGQPAPLMKSISTVIYHEVALALTMIAVMVLALGGDNLTGVWTFLILWLMRLSAKINVYLGVPNITDEFLPTKLQYLKTYFCRRPMNLFFPVVITVATISTALLGILAMHPSRTDAQAASYMLAAALLALAVIEHWFLVIPFNSAQLWAWNPDDRNDTTTSNLVAGSPVPAIVTRGVR